MLFSGVASAKLAKGEGGFVSMARREIAEQERLSKALNPNEKHLCTDHLLGDLKGRTIPSRFITIAAQGVKFVLSLASIMVLGRVLTPKDFGLFAMVRTIMGYLIIFKHPGLSTATV
jgi:hypothetical protein